MSNDIGPQSERPSPSQPAELSRADDERQFPEPAEVIRKLIRHEARNLESASPTGTTDDLPKSASRSEAHSPEAEPVPDRIGRYEVRRLLGHGGFGRVYLAYDEELQRHIAVKVPRRERISNPADIEAYLQEARLLARLDHPHIVPVLDVGRTNDGSYFVVSKLVKGCDLRQRIKDDRLSYREAAELIATVAEALHYAHLQKVIHRDIKPANILLDVSGKPFLADFGLALKDEDFGKGSGYAGTPAYMSPEQARGEGHLVDGRSDIFSLGAVLYELLTGERPFSGSNRQEIADRISTLAARPPRQLDDSIPKELERICLKALAKQIDHRYTTAKDLADDLRHLIGGSAAPVPGSAPTTSLPARREVMVLMFTDIVASTAQKTQIGTDAFARNLRRHDDIFKRILAGFPRAEVLRETGDGFFARFESASDAVLAAIQFQEAIRDALWEAVPILVKIGIHQGEAIQLASLSGEPHKIVGLTADLAARLTSLANANQILLSRTVFDDAQQFLQGGRMENLPFRVRWHSHGSRALKDANQLPVEILEVGREDFASFAPPAGGPILTGASGRSPCLGEDTDRPPAIRVKFANRLLRARNWQHRPELDALGRWWRTTDCGVCALTGIGGAGKTSIVERFLWTIPGLLPARADVQPDQTLRPPNSTFVFSFFEAPSPDTFFQTLADWLGNDGTFDRSSSYHQILKLFEQAEVTRLLVLDGLEKVQDDSLRGGPVGQVTDGRLRDLILRISDGMVPGCRAVLTTRYDLVDAVVNACPFFQSVVVEELTPTASITLLRSRGVRGTDRELEALGREYGFHALSLDLLGGYLVRFCEGIPRANLPLTRRGQSAGAIDAGSLALHAQEERFEELAESYRRALAHRDPAALALLQRVCLFRLGANSTTLAKVFLGTAKAAISGPELCALDQAGLENRLSLLVEMHLLEASADPGQSKGHTVYTAHPAVRDSFLRSLQQSVAQEGHQVLRRHLLTAIPSSDLRSADGETLDLLEETIFHTVRAGEVEEAWRLYSSALGGYNGLGRRRGFYERGERICRMFEDPDTVPPSIFQDARTELALYLRNLGRLEAAIKLQSEMVGQTAGSTRAEGLQVLAQLQFLRGRLRQSEESITMALAGSEHDRKLLESCIYVRAHVKALRGNVPAAFRDFETARELQEAIDGRPRLYALRGILYCRLLQRMGRLDEAVADTLWNRQTLTEMYGEEHQHIANCNLLLASILTDMGKFDSAREFWGAAHDWAVRRGATEHLCLAALIRAQIACSEAQIKGVRALDEEIRTNVEAGLRIARECGLAVHHVDLLLIRCRLHLLAERAVEAEQDARRALYGSQVAQDPADTYQSPPLDSDAAPSDRGTFPLSKTGGPDLLASTHPDFGYAWGEVAGRELLGEAIFQQTLKGELLHSTRQSMLRAAAHQLQSATDLRKQLGVAQSDKARDRLNQIVSLLN